MSKAVAEMQRLIPRKSVDQGLSVSTQGVVPFDQHLPAVESSLDQFRGRTNG
jgi:hypothetical protein